VNRLFGVALLAPLLWACTRSNRNLLTDLEASAKRAPRADADALLQRRDWPLAFLGGPNSTRLPLRKSGLPVVRGSVNGVELMLVLDTGASVVALSGAAARKTRLYLPPGKEVEAISPGYNPGYRRAVCDSIRLGALRFGRGVVGVPSREATGRAPGGLTTRTWGILGCPALGRFVVRFDFRRHEVSLRRHGGPAGAPLFTEARVNGTRLWMLVDSGAGRTYLEPWAASRLGLLSERDRPRHTTKSAAFGRGHTTAIRLDRLGVAGQHFTDVRAAVVNTFGDIVLPDGHKPAGLLGLAGLGERVWTIDFRRRRLHVE